MLCKKCKRDLQDNWINCPWCGTSIKKKAGRRQDGLLEKSLVINGKRKTFYAKTERELNKKILAYSNDPNAQKTKPFSFYADELEKSWDNLSYYTARGYKAPFRRCIEQFGSIPVSEISPYAIKKFLDELGKTLSQKTVKTHLSLISQTLDLAVLDNAIQTNPATVKYKTPGLKSQKRDAATEEAAELIRQHWNESLYSFLAYFLLNTGLRKGEALALQFSDIDVEKKRISVSKSVYYIGDTPHIKEPKTKAGIREVVLPDCVFEKMKLGKPNGFVFSLDGENPIPSHCIDAGWDKFCKAHNIGEWNKDRNGKNRFKVGVTFHQLRHYYATRGSELGIPREVMVEMMGHSSYIVTEGYTHIREAALNAAADKLNS